MARISPKIKKRPLLGRLIKIKYCVLAAIFKICAKTTPSCKFSACNINAAENTHIWPQFQHRIVFNACKGIIWDLMVDVKERL